MTYALDYSEVLRPTIGVPSKVDGGRMLLRAGARMGAVVCVLVAAMVWVAPGASWESDVMLFKLLLFVVSLMASLGLWQAGMQPVPPTVEVDVANREVRLIRSCAPVQKRVIERCTFSNLEAVDLEGRCITFWAKGGRLLAQITLSNATAHASLLAALRGAGKLA